MKTAGFGRPLAHSLLAALMVSISPLQGVAQSHDDHGGHSTSERHKPTPQESELVQAVRTATEKYKNVRSVEGPGDGYELKFGCVSGGDFGAMGMHFVNFGLVDGEVDVTKPEIILFEPTPNGGIRITGADFLTPVAAWDAAHAVPPETHAAPPELGGQLFHLFDSPNRFGLDPFYTLHVWAWKDNPNGTFGNWNPDVSCDAFNPDTPKN
jgi:hypothetical protein